MSALDSQQLYAMTHRRETRSAFEALWGQRDIEPAVHALSRLDDPRIVADLRRTLLDPAAPEAVRLACGVALGGMINAPSPADDEIRAWFHSDDAVLRRHAVRCMNRPQCDLVSAILDDLAHPLLPELMQLLGFWHLGDAASCRQVVAILEHEDAEMRFEAARLLVYPEPVFALDALLHASGDEEAQVVAQSLRTLEYYPTQSVIAAASRLRDHPDSDVRVEAEAPLFAIRMRAAEALTNAVTAPSIRAWLEPVWETLGVTEEDVALRRERDSERPAPPRRQPPWLASPAAFDATFGELDVDVFERREALRTADWSAAPASARPSLVRRLLANPDALVRHAAAKALAEWGERDALGTLLDERNVWIRRAAFDALASFGPDEELAARAWAEVEGRAMTEFYDILTPALRLSASTDRRERGRSLVRDPDVDEYERIVATRVLADDGARDVVASLLPLLEEPPVVTWAVHEALADAAEKLALPLPSLEVHAEIDHLAAQVLVARARARA